MFHKLMFQKLIANNWCASEFTLLHQSIYVTFPVIVIGGLWESLFSNKMTVVEGNELNKNAMSVYILNTSNFTARFVLF